MRVLESIIFPQNDQFLALRWVRGSGLQGLDETLHDVKMQLELVPGYGLRLVNKPGACLIVGNPQNRSVSVFDPQQRMNPRRLGAASVAANPRDIKLYQQQHATRLGAAGGLRGRLLLAVDTPAAWALVQAEYSHLSTLQHFVAQADARGEFALDLRGILWPDDASEPQLTLTVQATPGLSAGIPPDPDAFSGYQISTDDSAANLQASLSETLTQYGEVKNLGDHLIAPI